MSSPPPLPPSSSSTESSPAASPYNTVVGGLGGAGNTQERVQELLHARQLAREIDVIDSDDKKSALVSTVRWCLYVCVLWTGDAREQRTYRRLISCFCFQT